MRRKLPGHVQLMISQAPQNRIFAEQFSPWNRASSKIESNWDEEGNLFMQPRSIGIKLERLSKGILRCQNLKHHTVLPQPNESRASRLLPNIQPPPLFTLILTLVLAFYMFAPIANHIRLDPTLPTHFRMQLLRIRF